MSIDLSKVQWDAAPAASNGIDLSKVQWDQPKSTPTGSLADLAAGAVRGAGSIGATIMAPLDIATDLVNGRGLTLQGNKERRAEIDSGLQSLGANPESLAYKAGKFSGELAGTAGAGPAAGLIARAAGAAPALSSAIATGGLSAQGAGLATRAIGGAIGGAATAALANPEDVAIGAGIGGALPLAARAVGVGLNQAGSALRGNPTSTLVTDAAQAAKSAGYQLAPSEAGGSLVARALEGVAGKQSVGQVLSADNQPLTNRLAARALGLAEDQPLTLEALDAARKEAGQAYAKVAELGTLDARGAQLPASAGVRSYTDAMLQPRTEVDAAGLIGAWRQANHDASAWFRAAARDANPETMARARASAAEAKQINDFLENRLQAMGRDDLLQNLRAARVRIAKSHDVEGALVDATGNVDARKLAALDAKKPGRLTGELKQIADFAKSFPKVARTPEAAGGVPPVSPLDTVGALASGSYAALVGRPLARLAVTAKKGPIQRSLARAPAASASLTNDQTLNRLSLAGRAALVGPSDRDQ